jgi:HPt (histidine-containing phosphotransfer) domain-containing protein
MTVELDPDCELPPRLLSLFLRTTPIMMTELVAALARGESETARAAAHKLKGSLYAAGASALAEELEALRALLSNGSAEDCKTLLHEIEADFRDVVAELNRRAEARG